MVHSILFYQHYWWFLISLLASLLVFLLFVQGGQTLISRLGKKPLEQTMIVNSLGRKWELTFTTLVVFGGGFFASFPLFYSTSFGGAYWLWMIILFSFIVQAVSYEFRSRKGNLLGTKTYDAFLYLNGLVGVVLLGVAVATMFTGSDFTVSRDNILNRSMPVISSWGNRWHGLEAIASPVNLLLGFALFFLARVQASLYFMNNIDSEDIFKRSKRQVLINAVPFLVLFITFMVIIFLRNGYSVNPETGVISVVSYKYFINMVEMPWNAAIFLAGVVLVLYAIVRTLFSKHYTCGIWFSGIGTILVVLSLLFMAGYNNTPYYPSATDMQSSLTVYNSSSSFFTLKVMSIVSLVIPVVVAYIYYAWRSMDKKSITPEEMESGGAKY